MNSLQVRCPNPSLLGLFLGVRECNHINKFYSDHIHSLFISSANFPEIGNLRHLGILKINLLCKAALRTE